jgi:hypothetical protein
MSGLLDLGDPGRQMKSIPIDPISPAMRASGAHEASHRDAVVGSGTGGGVGSAGGDGGADAEGGLSDFPRCRPAAKIANSTPAAPSPIRTHPHH